MPKGLTREARGPRLLHVTEQLWNSCLSYQNEHLRWGSDRQAEQRGSLEAKGQTPCSSGTAKQERLGSHLASN